MAVRERVDVPLPRIEDMYHVALPRPADAYNGPRSGETIAWGMAVYAGVHCQAYDSHKNLAMQLAWEYEPGNVWVLPTRERLPYPYAIFYALTGMFETEKLAGRKADWFFWMDDDVAVPRDVVKKLRAAADPETKPFVAAVGYDRQWPHYPAVWTIQDIKGMEIAKRFMPVPESGTHEVQCTGLCAALFHRSLFDKVSEPWFAVAPPIWDLSGGSERGINPDTWWSDRMRATGIPIHVCCDVEVWHIGQNSTVCGRTAEALREANRCGRPNPP